MSDDTDNNTGERKVYAMNMYLERGDPNYVTVTMRCSNGMPAIFVEWQNLSFPDQTVLTISPEPANDVDPTKERYLFEKSADMIDRGLRASPETSGKIVAAVGNAKIVNLIAHLATGTQLVVLDMQGTQRAWQRVVRHCPVKTTVRPPL